MGNTRKNQLNRLLQAHPGDPFLHHAMGLECVKSGADGQARFHFEKALRSDPDHAGTYYHLGKLLERQNHPREAMDIYQKGISVTTELGEAHLREELKGALELLQEEMPD